MRRVELIRRLEFRCRLYQMTFTGDDWTLHREDPDFHQRFVASVSADRIQGQWDASED